MSGAAVRERKMCGSRKRAGGAMNTPAQARKTGAPMHDHRTPDEYRYGACVHCATPLTRERRDEQYCTDYCEALLAWKASKPQPPEPDNVLRFREKPERQKRYAPRPAPGVDYVYFIRSGDSGPIKIGKAGNPLARLSELQVGNPEPLRIVALARGNETLERLLHHVLQDHRVRGEWFRPDTQVVELALAARENRLAAALAEHGVSRRELFVLKVAA